MMISTHPGPALFTLLAAWLILPATVMATDPELRTGNEAALVRLAAGRIDAVLGDVAASTQALGREYAAAHALRARASGPKVDWRARRHHYDGYSGYRTWPATASTAPGFQGPAAAIYRYATGPLGEAGRHELDVFSALVPVFRGAYRSFDFSAAKAAVLYYRDSSGLASLGHPSAQPSAFDPANRAVEAVLAAAARGSDGGVIQLDVDGDGVLAMSLPRTGWFLVLLRSGGEHDGV